MVSVYGMEEWPESKRGNLGIFTSFISDFRHPFNYPCNQIPMTQEPKQKGLKRILDVSGDILILLIISHTISSTLPSFVTNDVFIFIPVVIIIWRRFDYWIELFKS